MTRLVAGVLVLWESLHFATEALTVVPTIVHRGWPAALELAAHALVAAVAAAGGFAVWNHSAHARPLGSVAVVASSARTLQSLYWSTLPSATMPGDEILMSAVAIVAAVVALTIINSAKHAST